MNPQLLLRLHNLVFVVLLLAAVGLLGWLSQQHRLTFDWTHAGRNTLAEPSRALLADMPGPVTVTVFASESEALRASLADLLTRYQREKADFSFRFVNPDLEPDRVRRHGISLDGELLLSYQGREQTLGEASEEAVSNALQRLARSGERRLLFALGHGERSPAAGGRLGYATLTQRLAPLGVTAGGVQLAAAAELSAPAVLVLADPRSALLPAEVARIQQWLETGGNLLWLTEPNAPEPLGELAETLGVSALPGLVVDATTRLFGVDDPSFALVTQYPGDSAITADFELLTVFPRAAALDVQPVEDWQATPFLRTSASSWTETSTLEGKIAYNPGSAERSGPLTLGVALSRPHPQEQGRQQRVVVLGDADFLADAYLGNGGNLDLALAVVNWLSHDDALIHIPARPARDRNLELSPVASGLIGFGFLFVLPLLLLAAGSWVWWRRRRR